MCRSKSHILTSTFSSSHLLLDRNPSKGDRDGRALQHQQDGGQHSGNAEDETGGELLLHNRNGETDEPLSQQVEEQHRGQ